MLPFALGKSKHKMEKKTRKNAENKQLKYSGRHFLPHFLAFLMIWKRGKTHREREKETL